MIRDQCPDFTIGVHFDDIFSCRTGAVGVPLYLIEEGGLELLTPRNETLADPVNEVRRNRFLLRFPLPVPGDQCPDAGSKDPAYGGAFVVGRAHKCEMRQIHGTDFECTRVSVACPTRIGALTRHRN